MKTSTSTSACAVVLGFAGLLAACGGSRSGPVGPVIGAGSTSGGTVTAGTVGASVRLRCEIRPGRSKISADGRNLSPHAGTFSARVQAAGGTATAPARQAVGGEAEFDFDSDRGDIAAGATPIAPDFIVAREGPDVTAEILDASGAVVARGSAECEVS